MANNNWVKVKPGVGIKNFIGLMGLGTIVIGLYAVIVRAFALRGK